MPQKRIDAAQTVAIYDRLKNVLTSLPAGPDGRKLCRYHPGYNDDVVAKEFNVSPRAVRHLRAELFGAIFIRTARAESAPEAETYSFEKRIATLEAANEALGIALTASQAAYSDLTRQTRWLQRRMAQQIADFDKLAALHNKTVCAIGGANQPAAHLKFERDDRSGSKHRPANAS